jgi:hypothetical protein
MNPDSNQLPTKRESAEEFLARTLPPKGYKDYLIICTKEFCYFKHQDDLQDHDEIAFFDGDMRDVLLPDDSRVKALLAKP